MTLPPDSHAHSEWSWDARQGSMERSCARAVELGLPAIAFTEHLDRTVWTVDLAGVDDLPADHPVVTMSGSDGPQIGRAAAIRTCRGVRGRAGTRMLPKSARASKGRALST